MSAIFKRGNAHIQGNLTPMIDMTFLLIIFFVLVSRIVDRESVDMDLPNPRQAATVKAGEDQRVVINVLPGPNGQSRGYRVGGMNFAPDSAGLAAMTQHLGRIYRINPQVKVNLRADKSTHYEYVEPVMQAVSTAARTAGATNAAARVNLVVVQER